MKWLCLSWLCLLLFSCRPAGEVEPFSFPLLMEIPEGFPNIEEPVGNEFSPARWELGKKLFFEKALSADYTLSCASCHNPALAFSDEVDFSPGVANRPGTRNSPTLANIAYHPYFTREGGVPTLEMQVLIPIQEHNEFDYNIVLVAERLTQDSTYVRMAQDAYNREPDAFVITRAIACFERSLLSGNSPYDQYHFQGDSEALSQSQQRGMELFFDDRTQCSSCHSGFNFTNYAFENNGLFDAYPDDGRFRLTAEESDRALFKVPSLRNIALTAPYMHDGSIQTLEEVVRHYQSGGANHPNKSPLIRPMILSEREQQDLVQFLYSLTDETFVTNSLFTNSN